jgi:hypothetical protein
LQEVKEEADVDGFTKRPSCPFLGGWINDEVNGLTARWLDGLDGEVDGSTAQWLGALNFLFF